MPRRIYTYPDLPGWGALNFVETVGAFLLGVAVLLLVWDMWRVAAHGDAARRQPVGRLDAGVGHHLAAAAAQLRGACRRSRSARPLLGPVGIQARARERRPPQRRSDGHRDARPTPLLGIAGLHLQRGDLLRLADRGVHRLPDAQPGPGPHDLDVAAHARCSACSCSPAAARSIWPSGALARDDQRGFLRLVAGHHRAGRVFLIGQVTEYLRLYAEGITIGTEPVHLGVLHADRLPRPARPRRPDRAGSRRPAGAGPAISARAHRAAVDVGRRSTGTSSTRSGWSSSAWSICGAGRVSA